MSSEIKLSVRGKLTKLTEHREKASRRWFMTCIVEALLDVSNRKENVMDVLKSMDGDTERRDISDTHYVLKYCGSHPVSSYDWNNLQMRMSGLADKLAAQCRNIRIRVVVPDGSDLCSSITIQKSSPGSPIFVTDEISVR